MKMNTLKTGGAVNLSCLTVVVCAALSQPAIAKSFKLDNGISGSWNTTISAGASIRMEDANKDFIAISNGGNNPNLGATAQDDGNLNFEKNDVYSSVVKVISEIDLNKGNFRFFARAKAWYDYTLSNEKVAHGHQATGYVPDTKLDDSNYDDQNKFSGIELLDFYVQGFFEVGEQEIDAKIGRSVANWGESLFFLGVNSYSVLDVAALRRPGAELKEALMPVNQLQLSFPFESGLTVDAFYQFSWDKTTVDGCGTYFSGADIGFDSSCNALTLNLAPDGAALASGLYLKRGADKEASDSGQFGVSAKYFVESVDTEFGLYYVNYHSHLPIISATTPGGAAFFQGAGPFPPFIPSNPATYKPAAIGNLVTSPDTSYFLEYAEDIQIIGLSASTSLFGWSVAGELSYHQDLPVQINAPDALTLLAQGMGPLASEYGVAVPFTGPAAGTVVTGFDRKNKTQLQFNFLKTWSQFLGASNTIFAGEVAMMSTSDIGDSATDVRYGRAPMFGAATHVTTGPNGCTTVGNKAADWCAQDGFVTDFAWGYKFKTELSYTNLIAGTAVKPSLFVAHDVSGYSPDGMISEGRKTIGLGLKFDINKTHVVNFTYNNYLNDAEFDFLSDRDFLSVSVSTSF